MSECTHDCGSCSETCAERSPESFREEINKMSSAKKVIGIVAAWCRLGLLPVSLVCCATVLILEHFIV